MSAPGPDLHDLVRRVDRPGDYTPSAVRRARAAIEALDPDPDDLRAAAIAVAREVVRERLDGFSPVRDTLHPPTSAFFDHHTGLDILKEEFTAWTKRRQDMDFDVWSYAIGGG